MYTSQISEYAAKEFVAELTAVNSCISIALQGGQSEELGGLPSPAQGEPSSIFDPPVWGCSRLHCDRGLSR